MKQKVKEVQSLYKQEIIDGKIPAKPFLKWAGGKGSLIRLLFQWLPPHDGTSRYFEPFLGGGAFYFALQPQLATLGDSNSQLIELYQTVRDDVEQLIDILQVHRNDKDYFYFIREQSPEQLTTVERGARFIYLNHTCFNGLYRVNSKGKFNVPYGKYNNPTICDAVGLRAASQVLQTSELVNLDFGFVLDQARRGDFVYFDPPYQPINRTSSFTSYTQEGFGETEQSRLADLTRKLDFRGVQVMVSNSDTPLIRELYKGFTFHEIMAKRAINCKATGRGPVQELVITNY